MRHHKTALAYGTLVACVLVLSLPGFATVVSHVSSGSAPNKGMHVYSPSKLSPIIYAQDPDFNGAVSSQNDTTGGFGNFATTYDNFTLSGSYNIDEVQWVGSYFNPATQGTITAFTVNFYADAAGQPGGLLASYSGPGSFGETFLGFDNAGDPTFLYGGLLGTPFAAAAGVQYWLSIVPDVGFPPQWGWETSVDGDGLAYQDFFGTRGALANDLSFALSGTAAPEPGSLVLMGTGLVGLAGVIRRKLS